MVAQRIYCVSWSQNLMASGIIVLGPREAVTLVAERRAAGSKEIVVTTVDGDPVLMFELHVLAERQPIHLHERHAYSLNTNERTT